MTSSDGIVYEFEWLDPKVKVPSKPQTKQINCSICGEPMNEEDRRDGVSMGVVRGDEVHPERSAYFNSIYDASRKTGISVNALVNASKKGNLYVTNRKGKVPVKYRIYWKSFHKSCLEKRRLQRKKEEEEEEEKEKKERGGNGERKIRNF